MPTECGNSSAAPPCSPFLTFRGFHCLWRRHFFCIQSSVFLRLVPAILTLIITLINEYSTKKLLLRATQASISAHADVSATLRNAEVMRAMGMAPGLKDRWATRRDEQISWQALASDRGSALMAGMKSFRQIVQVFILGIGGYLCLEGELSAGGIVAASIIVGRALAPIELAVSQWKVFQNARGAWERLQELFRAVPQNQQRMSLPAPKGSVKVRADYRRRTRRKDANFARGVVPARERRNTCRHRPKRRRQIKPYPSIA